MLRKLTICAALMMLASVASANQTTFSNTGGTVTLGSNLVLANSNLGSPTGTVAFTCPVASISPTIPFTFEWSCLGGNFTLQSSDGSTSISGTFTSGTLTLEIIGGGSHNLPSYLYVLTGNFSGTLTSNGQTQAITGATVQSLASMSSQLGTGTVQQGTTAVNPVYAPTYVADTSNGRIVRIDDITGTNWTTFGALGSSISQFTQPWGISVDAAGKIYVVDSSNCRIVRIDDMSGANWTELGSCGTGTNQFMNPTGLFVDPAGKIYVADSANGRIIRMDDMNGTNWISYGSPSIDPVTPPDLGHFRNPAGIVVDTAGRIYVADTQNSRIIRIDDISGTNWIAFSGSSQFSYPSGLWLDATGRIYVADTLNNRIVRMDDMTGLNVTVLGTLGGGSGQFVNPYAMFVDPGGTIYVADSQNHRIARFDDMTGLAWTSLGNYGAGVDQFASPRGVYSVPPAAPVAALTFAPSSLVFGNQILGAPSAPQNIAVTNIGGATLSITSIVAGGDFAQTNSCTSLLVGGASCTISVTFAPTATGTRTGALTLTDNAPNSPQTASLTGTGGVPVVTLSPTSLTFSAQLLNTSSAAQTVMLTNTGNAALAIAGITVNGDFSQTNNCGSSLAAGASCTISITFTPTASGTGTGTLTLTDSAGDSPQTVSLTGAGTDDFSVSSNSPTSVTVNASQTATYILSLAGMTGLDRSVSFICADPASASVCSISPNPLMLSGTTAATATVTVTTMAPTTLLPRTHPPNLPLGAGLRLALLWLLSLAMLAALLRRQAGLRRRACVGLAGVLLFAVVSVGCGGGGNGGAPPPQPTGTQAGTYLVTVTANSGGVSHNLTLTLKVN